MEEFDLVEADFQQYYQLDVSKIGFIRYARLFANLPLDSRVMRKWAPAANWTWQDETNSRILHELEVIGTTLYNVNRKRGAKAIKPGAQFQPDEVKKAKDKYSKQRKNQESLRRERQAMRAFWQRRNPNMKIG